MMKYENNNSSQEQARKAMTDWLDKNWKHSEMYDYFRLMFKNCGSGEEILEIVEISNKAILCNFCQNHLDQWLILTINPVTPHKGCKKDYWFINKHNGYSVLEDYLYLTSL